MDSVQIGGAGCLELVEEFGTPLYVYDENLIRKQIREAVGSFSSDRFKTKVVYASKAFSCTELFRILSEQGAGFDVVSGGELYGVSKAGVCMDEVYFHGNNKSDREIEEALSAGAGYFVIDNSMECERLVAAAERTEKRVKALLRINPGISAHTHEYIMTAAPDSKFGIHIKDRKHIEDVITKLSRSRYVKHAGFHSHIGSQITDGGSFKKAVEAMVGFLADMKKELGLDSMELSVGGGFGIRYLPEDDPPSLSGMCRNLVLWAEEETEKRGVKISKLIAEPGRAVVGEAGSTIYTAGDMKRSGEKDYIFVDGGMSDNIRPALYEAEYSAFTVGKDGRKKEGPLRTFCLAGKNCESGDVIIKEASLPETELGDLILVRSTGAYCYSMASNYNRLGRPAVVFVKDGKARLIIRRETYEDQYRLEV